MKTYTLDELKAQTLGEVGTPRRDQYEYELKLDLIGEMIRTARKERNLTQEQLGKLVGVQKAQISKLENNASNVTIGTIVKVFTALKANIKLQMNMVNGDLNIA